VNGARWLRAGAGVAGTAILVATARADAPVDQYDLFNMSSETITDTFTSLTWQRSAPAQPVTFYDAASYCAALSLATPAGATAGWRVPSYKELLTLVDEVPHTTYVDDGLVQVWIDANAFDTPPYFQTMPSEYWTSSFYVAGAGSAYVSAYVVDFSQGRGDQQSAGTPEYVRCVHD